uniref:NUT midline carcinoma, family member 1 n=1 Tax=Jaculus jaculus TaxID=51337 RepID=A0A8C5KYL4_JACJA
MASDGASPLPGPDVAMKAGATHSPFTTLPFPSPTPGPPDQAPWEPSPQHPVTPAFSPGNPLLLSAFPSSLLVTGDGSPGPRAGTGQVIVKIKTEGGPAEPSQTQNLILTQTACNWIASGAPCEGPDRLPPRYLTASNVKTILPTMAIGVSQEVPTGLPLQAAPPAAQLAPIVPLEKTWPRPQGTTGEGGLMAAQKPLQDDLACASKGVYENFRRWQRYKTLARRHLSQSPDVEALSCFLIPVLRSLARRKPTMTLEEALPRALQEWEYTSNFDRMIFYEMAEKFMEFEAEEELQKQNTKLIRGSQGLSPVTPLKHDPPGSLTPEACQQPVYIPKKAASKTRAPRQRQRKSQRPPVLQAPKEIPPEAVKEYSDIMEGSHGKQEEEEEEQQEDEGIYPDPRLLSYFDELCSHEVFVSKVEAIIHPQFLADLLSPEQQRDPLALFEELEQEEGLTFAQLVQKRLLALEDEEDTQPPPSRTQSDSSPSVSDEEEDGGQRPRTTLGPHGAGGTIRIQMSASPGKQAREIHDRQEQALGSSRGMCKDGHTLSASSSWGLELEPAVSRGMQESLGMQGRRCGQVVSQLSVQQDGHLGGAGSPRHYLVADRTSEALSLCWQESAQPMRGSSLDAGLTEPALLQGHGLEKQVLGIQAGQQVGEEIVLTQGRGPSTVSQEGSSRTVWGGPPMVQKSSPRGAGSQDKVSVGPGLWLSSEMDTLGSELPIQVGRVIESPQDGEYIQGHETLGSRSSISLGPGQTSAPGDVGGSMVPCACTDATTVKKRNFCSLPGPLVGTKPALGSKEKGNQSPETTQDPSDLWAEGCTPLLERIGVPTLESSKDSQVPTCQGNLCILGIQTSQEAESKGNSLFALLKTTEHGNMLHVRDKSDPQAGASDDSCSRNFKSYDLQRGGREDSTSSKPNDLVPLQSHQESFTLGTPKSTFHQALGGTSLKWGARGTSVLRETSTSKTSSLAHRARGREKEEDEELSNFAYLLASKLSLSPRGLSLGPHHAATDQGVEKVSYTSAEPGSFGQTPCPATKSGKQAVVGGPVPAVKKLQPGQLGVSGEKHLALGVVQSPQPRKRRRDSLVTGRRKKRRRNQ